MTIRETHLHTSEAKESGKSIAFRLLPDETKSLEKLADRDDRSPASLCRRVIRDWLRQQTATNTKELA